MAGAHEERLAQHTLFLACTRPVMFLGVTLEAFIINLFVTSVLFLALKSMLYLGVAPLLHLAMRHICKNDPNAFRVLFEYIATKGRCRTRRHWRASTVSPLRLTRPRTLRELKKEAW